jgi:hypothetical protein
VRRPRMPTVLGVLLASAGLVAGDGDPQDVPVSVRIGLAQVRLNVRLHFADNAGLPTPGELSVADEHDRGHDAHTYCYRYPAKGGMILLELYDSDFGLHTARLSRVGKPAQQCPVLSYEPEVLVDQARYRLTSLTWREPPGFQVKKTRDSLEITREWTYSDPTRPHMWGTCFWRAITLTIEPLAGPARSLTIQNWEEPGC